MSSPAAMEAIQHLERGHAQQRWESPWISQREAPRSGQPTSPPQRKPQASRLPRPRRSGGREGVGAKPPAREEPRSTRQKWPARARRKGRQRRPRRAPGHGGGAAREPKATAAPAKPGAARGGAAPGREAARAEGKRSEEARRQRRATKGSPHAAKGDRRERPEAGQTPPTAHFARLLGGGWTCAGEMADRDDGRGEAPEGPRQRARDEASGAASEAARQPQPPPQRGAFGTPRIPLKSATEASRQAALRVGGIAAPSIAAWCTFEAAAKRRQLAPW